MKIEPPLSITGVEITIEPPKSLIQTDDPRPALQRVHFQLLTNAHATGCRDGHVPAWQAFRGTHRTCAIHRRCDHRKAYHLCRVPLRQP